jgi:hypothetical protein
MIAAILAFVAFAEPIAFLLYLSKRDKREWDERSELLTRVQAPQVLNPRAVAEPAGEFKQPEPDYRDLAGTIASNEVQFDGAS